MTFPLTLLFMFLVFWRPQEWLMPWMFGWPVLDAIVYMAVVALAAEMSQGTARFPKTPAVMLTCGLFVAAIMSHVVHTYFQGILDTIPETFRLCFFLMILLVVLINIRRVQGVIVVMIVGAVFMAIHAILQAKTGEGFGGQPPMRWFNVDKDKWVQQSLFFGIFEDPNDLGQFLATCLPLCFAFSKRLGFVAFVFGCLLAGLLATGMLTTESRGTLVGVCASVGCMIFLKLPVRWMPYMATVALLGALIACGVFGESLLDESARDRVMFWGEANRYFKTAPLFGGGYGMFNDITGVNNAAHNAYVLCYTELGLFGYWFWFNTLVLGFIGCWRTRKVLQKARTEAGLYLRRVAGLAMAASAGFAASSYFLSRAYLFPLFFLFGLMNSIPLIALRYLPDDHPPLVDLNKDVLFTGTISALISIVYIYISILLLNR